MLVKMWIKGNLYIPKGFPGTSRIDGCILATPVLLPTPGDCHYANTIHIRYGEWDPRAASESKGLVLSSLVS